jgi:hypothetical protein
VDQGLDVDLGGLHVEGLLLPSSPEWDPPGGARAYVRQEYAAWREWEAQPSPRAGSEEAGYERG